MGFSVAPTAPKTAETSEEEVAQRPRNRDTPSPEEDPKTTKGSQGTDECAYEPG